MELTRSRGPLRGSLDVPGDKSVSHRAVMFGALAEGTTEITHFLEGADCLSTISCFRQMGIPIERTPSSILVRGKGLRGLAAPAGDLDAGNSGTTVRLLSGILAGQSFASVLTGDASIRRRPMRRVMDPLRAMGARIRDLEGNGCAPLAIEGTALHAADWDSRIASAQVKSCVLLAGLYADGPVSFREPALSRDHTERMLQSFGASLTREGTRVTIEPAPRLEGQKIYVPGDISSAAYFIAAALLVPGSQVLLRRVGINPTRDGMLRVLRAMGADIRLENETVLCGEPCADLLVTAGPLKAAEIGGDIIPALIDELPVLAVLAAFAEGTTVIRDAAELKVKESDRIAVMTEGLRRMGADVQATEDGMIIMGGKPLHGAVIDPAADHRAAMSFAVAALAAGGTTTITDEQCVAISYPTFFADLSSLSGGQI